MIAFSYAVEGDGPACFAAAERFGVEGMSPGASGSAYRSGRTDRWLKTKSWTVGKFVVLGTKLDTRSGAPVALLARRDSEGLSYVGGAFFAMRGPRADALLERLEPLTSPKPAIPALRHRGAKWVKPELVVGVEHLRGSGGLRHAIVRSFEEWEEMEADLALSKSERATLRALAYSREGGVVLDWLAVFRLKQRGLVEDAYDGPRITAEGRRIVGLQNISPARS